MLTDAMNIDSSLLYVDEEIKRLNGLMIDVMNKDYQSKKDCLVETIDCFQYIYESIKDAASNSSFELRKNYIGEIINALKENSEALLDDGTEKTMLENLLSQIRMNVIKKL